jgi:glycolate oxidase FAD binding subunit
MRLPFFDTPRPLWRLSLPPATAPLELDGEWLTDWGGAQRWLITEQPVADVRAAAQAAGGHATLWREGTAHADVFHPLPPAQFALQRRLKQAFDPAGILNPGRLYDGL